MYKPKDEISQTTQLNELQTLCQSIDKKHILARREASNFDLYVVWSATTCSHDPDALGCYVTSDFSSSVVVNLRKICKASLRLVAEPEEALIGTLMHFYDLCLIHELTHWGGEHHSRNAFWNDFIMPRLIIPLCPSTLSEGDASQTDG